MKIEVVNPPVVPGPVPVGKKDKEEKAVARAPRAKSYSNRLTGDLVSYMARFSPVKETQSHLRTLAQVFKVTITKAQEKAAFKGKDKERLKEALHTFRDRECKLKEPAAIMPDLP